MQKYHNSIQDSAGNIVTGATVTVYDAGTTDISSIFEDDESTPLANPFTVADSNYSSVNSAIWFKAANGKYDVKVVNGADTETLEDVELFDVDDFSHTSTIEGATDTVFTGLADDDFVVWDTATSKFINATAVELGLEPADAAIQSHITATSGNPHAVTKADVGLGSVTDDACLPLVGGALTGKVTQAYTGASFETVYAINQSITGGFLGTVAGILTNLTAGPVAGGVVGHIVGGDVSLGMSILTEYEIVTGIQLTANSAAGGGIVKYASSSVLLGTTIETNIIDLAQTGVGADANFMKLLNDKDTFLIDHDLNIVSTSVWISPTGGLGVVTNILKYSESMEVSPWVLNAGTLTANYGESPDAQSGGSSLLAAGNLTQARTDINTLADRAFTFAGWVKIVTGTVNLAIWDDTGDYAVNSKTFSSLPVGVWQYVYITRTFESGRNSARTLEFRLTAGGSAEVYGFHAYESAVRKVYTPTSNFTSDTPSFGGVVNGTIHLHGDKKPVGVHMRAATDQSTNNFFDLADASGVAKFSIDSNYDFNFDTTTGSKLATGPSQKISLWGATPIVQPNGAGLTTGFTAGSGTSVNDDSTFTGNTGTKAYTIGDIVKALKDAGIMANS